MANQNKSRRNSRKQNKSRKNRNNLKQSRKNNNRNKRQNGGAYNAGALSLAQGQEYRELHRNQYGGGQVPNPAPVGDTGMLDPALRQMAAVSTLDRALGEIAGMSDMQVAAPTDAPAAQKGGRRKRSNSRKQRNTRKRSNSRKQNKKNNNKSRKQNKQSRRNKKQRGGAYSPASTSAPGMLLSPMQAARAGTADFSNPWLTK